jgi:hypothetical protein
MPVLLAPIAVIGVALLSFILLYQYERLFGSPLDGLARTVPVIGGYLARGVRAAVAYGKNILTGYVMPAIVKLVDWLLGLAGTIEHFAAAVNAYLLDLPGHLDHLLHVSVHEVVKLFVNPVRSVANEALGDAAAAAHGVDVLARDVASRLHGIEGDVAQEIDRALDVVRNVDLPNVERVLRGELHHAVDGVAGDVAQVQDWAAGWFDDILGRLEDLPLDKLLAGAAAGTAAYALAQVIANEAGLGRAECRAKVKQICATDPRAWEHLLALAVPLFAFPGLRELVEVASELVPQLAEAVVSIGER